MTPGALVGQFDGDVGRVDYDAVGNQTKDYVTSNGTRTYDAENRMITATDTANNINSSYTYEGSIAMVNYR